jgi:hypothetical protein
MIADDRLQQGGLRYGATLQGLIGRWRMSTGADWER